MKNTGFLVLGALGVIGVVGTVPGWADPAWDQYLGLNPSQKAQLKDVNQKRKQPMEIVRQDKDDATQTMVTQVKANAGDNALQATLKQVLDDIQVIDKADEDYWAAISGFLAPTQVAKIYLKGHPPKNPSAPGPQHPANPQPHINWNAFFGLSRPQAQQLKAADQARNSQMKPTREEQEAAVEQLNQLVQSGAADNAFQATLQPTLTTLFNDLHTEHQAEQDFWGTTLPGFLAPTQMAKLYLHRHPPKGGFQP